MNKTPASTPPSDDRSRTEPLRYRHLTVEERERITNGCGSKGGIVPVPNFFFEASCDHHDFNYWRGGTEIDRERADFEFYEAMLRDVHSRMLWLWRWWGYFLARLYYLAVRTFGRAHFHYAERQRDWAELDRELGRVVPEA